MDAVIIREDESTTPVREALLELADELRPAAERLGCAEELARIPEVVAGGASYQRQRAVAAGERRGPHRRRGQPAGRVRGRPAAVSCVETWLQDGERELIAFRRELHARPELGRQEHAHHRAADDPAAGGGAATRSCWSAAPGWSATSARVTGPVVVLRADLDALPIAGRASTCRTARRCPASATPAGTTCTPPSCSAPGCAGGRWSWPGTVRLVFQPAEEQMPGGALDVLDEGWLEGASAIFGLHCDPALEVGRVGLKSGALTAAADVLQVEAHRSGRAHLPPAQHRRPGPRARRRVATGLPAALSRLVDPRAGLSLVWGQVHAGAAANAIPRRRGPRGHGAGAGQGGLGVAPRSSSSGSCTTWWRRTARRRTSATTRGVPPVVNDPEATALLEAAARSRPRAGGGRPTRPVASAGRTSPGTWTSAGRDGAAGRPRPARGPRWTCTSRPSTSTRAAIAVGVRLLVGSRNARWNSPLRSSPRRKL